MTVDAARASGRDDPTPRAVVRPAAIAENAAAVAARFDGRLVGVTKAVCGDPVVASALLDGGADGIGDSRVRNLGRVGSGDDGESTRFDAKTTRINADTTRPNAETTLLRVPMASDAERVVATADRSLHSEPAVVRRIDAAAAARDTTHDAILMVDVGDRREGVLPGDVPGVVADLTNEGIGPTATEGARLAGLGTNLGCFGGVVPTPEKLRSFVDVVAAAEDAVGREFDVVSGGSTVTLPLVEDGDVPARVNELRVGEGILLGTDVTAGRRIPYLRGDAFELRAEVVECKRKPSTPAGLRARNVEGERPTFEERGWRTRAIVALGEQDADTSDLQPLDGAVEVLGASSDHTVLDVTDADRPIGVGDELGFRPGYRALVGAFTSEYVGREVVEQ